MLLITIFSQDSDTAPLPFRDHKQGIKTALDALQECKADNRECVVDVRRVFDAYMTAFIGSFCVGHNVDDIMALEELLELA